MRATTYGANALNQYTNASNPSYVQVTGFATASASVTVNGSAVYERGEYFHEEVSLSNGSPVLQTITAVASLTGTNATNSGHAAAADRQPNLRLRSRWQSHQRLHLVL